MANEIKEYVVTHRATVYRISTVDTGFGETIYILNSGWGNNYGEWIRLGSFSVAWSYIAEKMPVMAKREGDKEGWVMAFAKAGLEVFN